ncbi:MAG: hypothetical protein IT427_09910 [Pirellulales bacterium]|nr:hypothetical protein [Pirellulales bacterium]
MKDVKHTCYTCKREDFCVPGPSCVCGEVCDCDPCGSGRCRKCLGCLLGDSTIHRQIWKPSCDVRLYTRNKLYKYEVSRKVPTYKWIVEYYCDECQSATPCAGIDPVAPATSAIAAASDAAPPGTSSPTTPAELDLPHSAGTVEIHTVE